MTDNRQFQDMGGFSREKLIELYRMMVLIRITEERIADLIESSEIKCPCHLYTGQEAIATGVCTPLKKDDFVWGGHRSHGHYLAKGGDLKGMMAEIFGRVGGCSRGRGGSMHLFAPEVGIPGTVPLVAATIPIAAGSAMAAKLKGTEQVSVSFFGDGATEEGHFHETMNLAALYRLPVIFVCENNFYSSHLQLLERRPMDNLDKMADVYNIPGIRLDGNDVMAIYQATRTAAERARKGEGPTLLECRTYRWRGHVGHDMNLDVGVKRRDELKEWLPRDPVKRLRDHILSDADIQQELDQIDMTVKNDVEDAISFSRESPFPEPQELLEHVFVSR